MRRIAIIGAFLSSCAPAAPETRVASTSAALTTGSIVSIPKAVDETHVAFPDLACDGPDLVLVYRAGTNHQAGGRVRVRRSSDGGATWSAPTQLPSASTSDEREPSLLRMRDGRWMLSRAQFSARWADTSGYSIHEHRVTVSIGQSDLLATPAVTTPTTTFPPGPKPVWDSTDWRWEDPIGAPVQTWSTSSVPFYAGNDLGIPLYGGPLWEPFAPRSPRKLAILWRSAMVDRGAPWAWWRQDLSLPDAVAAPGAWHPSLPSSAWHLTEPAIARLHDGRLLLAARTSRVETNIGGQGPTIVAWSSDDGATWTGTRHWDGYAGTGWYGQAPALHVLSDGRVLIGTRDIAWTLNWWRVAIRSSTDSGMSWSAPAIIHHCTAADCGYPSFAECNGVLRVAYYLTNGTGIEVATLVP